MGFNINRKTSQLNSRFVPPRSVWLVGLKEENQVRILDGAAAVCARNQCSLAKASHWGNLRRQSLIGREFSCQGVSQKTYKTGKLPFIGHN